MVTLSWCLIWQIISFILPPNEYGCVYAWTTLGSGPKIDLQKIPILAKKIIFSDETHFDLGGYVNKQNCRTENQHAYIEKPTHPKRCLVWIFLRKWSRKGRYNQWRSLSGYVERIFVHKNWRAGYWQHLVLTGRLYVPHSMFCDLFLRSHYQLQIWCRLATSELRFDKIVAVGALKHRSWRYVSKRNCHI